MFIVYAISSHKRNYIYVGLTNNIERRFNQHQEGLNKTTKPYRPFILFHIESFFSRIEARKREKYLKSGAGKEYLRQVLSQFLTK
ncbi:MAG: GIY-YIG nuclease family protein [Bacteroidetes bacterium]|nr:GIY-YIG nuclease family protein [Bacteroidota bacterium]MBS1610128.1 GIY-YIG nuclease family protein [Bacteroidota bacterium]